MAVKLLPIKEFQRIGFLQEVNRLVLHPAGLALAVTLPFDVAGQPSTFGSFRVWDYRDDPEGMLFAAGEISETKMRRVKRAINRHVEGRYEYVEGHPDVVLDYATIPAVQYKEER
jgi:hypothetical protein